MLVVNVPTDQILRVNVLTDQTPRVTDVQTEQLNRVNVRMEQISLATNVPTNQILLVDVLMIVMIKIVYFVILILVNV